MKLAAHFAFERAIDELVLLHARLAVESRRDDMRAVVIAIAREIFKLLTRQIAIPEYADLRQARQAKNITLTAAAKHFGTWPTTITRIETGRQRDDAFADTYRTWLTTA